VHLLFTDFKKPMTQLGGRSCTYNILNKFGICIKLVRLIKMCQNENYSKAQVGIFPIRNDVKYGDALLPLVFNFDLEYAIRRAQVNQEGFKLNGTHQVLVYADVL
jgi:hypothetical protein